MEKTLFSLDPDLAVNAYMNKYKFLKKAIDRVV